MSIGCPCCYNPESSPSHHDHGEGPCGKPARADNRLWWKVGKGYGMLFCDECAEALLEDGIMVPAEEER